MGDWNPKANELFLEALEQPLGPARNALIDDACHGNERLKAQVIAMLDANERAANFLASPIEEAQSTNGDIVRLEQLGSFVGPYKLLQEIGEGGMGIVYMAEQSQPVCRTVALKIVRPGMDSRQVAARFEAERQALALMEHPNIARVLDAGMTDTGRPFFVMELVKGVPITTYCDDHRLTPWQRLELFVPVCRAIQHAHQKGIIHRDLKPSNVMVAPYDERPVPKVIDFGVAKAIGPKLTEHTLFTEFGAVIGTVEYMSPEQAELNQLDIDTRSDIYSLGVLLYELLAGTTPLERKRLKGTSVVELLKLVREEQPPRPSTRLVTTEDLPIIAASRGMEPRKLSGSIRGELDWVVMKALEKDRNRRYATAAALAEDIEHYLANEPVEACPPSAAYRFRVFARRHRVAMTAAVIVAASLVIATAISIWEATIARRAEGLAEQRLSAELQAREEATAINSLLQQMLQTASPASAKGGGYTVRQMLDDFSAQLGDQLKDQPAVEATLRATIGDAYRRMELFDKAEPHLKAALELRKRVFGVESAEYADSLVDYGWCVGRKNYEVMDKFAVEALDILQKLRLPAHYTIRPLAARVHALSYFKGRQQDAYEFAQKVVAIEPVDARERADVAWTLFWLANIESGRGKHIDGERLASDALARYRALGAGRHPDAAWCLATLGNSQFSRHKTDEAELALRESLDILRDYYDKHHYPIVAVSMALLPVALEKGDQSTIDEIRTTAEYALTHPDTDNEGLRHSADIFIILEMWENVEACFARRLELAPQSNEELAYYLALTQLPQHKHEAYRTTCQSLFPRTQRRPVVLQYLAVWTCLLNPECGVEYESVSTLAERVLATVPTDSRYRQAAAIAHYRAGRYEEAEGRLLEILEADLTNSSRAFHVVYSQLFLAMANERLGRHAEAQEWLRKAQDGIQALCKKEGTDVSGLPWMFRFTLIEWRQEAERIVMGDKETPEGPPARADTPGNTSTKNDEQLQNTPSPPGRGPESG